MQTSQCFHWFICCTITSYILVSSQANYVEIDQNISLNILDREKERETMDNDGTWRRSVSWVSKCSSKVFQPAYLCLSTGTHCFPRSTSAMTCWLRLKVFEIIRWSSRGCPVTIHEAVTAVWQKIKPKRNLRPSGNPRKRHGEINNRRNATYRHVTHGFISLEGIPNRTDVFLRTNSRNGLE